MAEKPKKVRGTATFYDDDRMEFRPQQPGEPQRLDVKKKRESSLYRTCSEKAPRLVAHLSAAADSADPVSEMMSDFNALTKDIQKKEPALPKGSMLCKTDDGLTIYANHAKMEITVQQVIRLEDHPSYEKFMLNQMQEIFKCFTINQTSLGKLSRAAQKSSRS